MLYPQYFIDDLKNRADLIRIIQPYAADQLRKAGKGLLFDALFNSGSATGTDGEARSGYH